jgi:hypothetical protein
MILGNALGRSLSPSSNSSWCTASQVRADHAANQARINARYGPALPSSPQLRGEADAAHHSTVISHAPASGACAGGSQSVRPRNIRRLRWVRPPQNPRITEIYFWVGMVPVKLGRSSHAHSASNISILLTGGFPLLRSSCDSTSLSRSSIAPAAGLDRLAKFSPVRHD